MRLAPSASRSSAGCPRSRATPTRDRAPAAPDRRRSYASGRLPVRLLERVQQQRHPVGAALDRRDAQVRVPAEHAVAHERGDRVVDRAVAAGHVTERVVAERLEVAAAAPLVGVAAVARVARVVRDEDARLREPGPHAVVAPRRRANARTSGPRTGPERITTTRAPCSSAYSTSASARAGSCRQMYGAAKIALRGS